MANDRDDPDATDDGGDDSGREQESSSTVPTAVSPSGSFVGEMKLSAMKSALDSVRTFRDATNQPKAADPLLREARLSHARAVAGVAKNAKLRFLAEAAGVGARKKDEQLAEAARSVAGARQLPGEELQRLSKTLNVASSTSAVLRGLDPKEISPMVRVLKNLEVDAPTVDPSVFDTSPLPEEALQSSVEPSVKPASGPREPTIEEAAEKMVKEGAIIQCASEDCGSMELVSNAHRFQQTEDGEYICPQCQDEERTFH